MSMKRKFVMEFDEPPAFLYVANDTKDEEIYLNGEKVKYWTGLDLSSHMDEVTAYTIDYIAVKDK